MSTTLNINGFVANEYLPGSWNITGVAGQQWYWQGSASDITTRLTAQPVIMPPTANGPLLPSANVGNLPDGSTQVEALQRAQADRRARRCALEPDYVEADEQAAYSNGNPGGAVQLAALQQNVLAWNNGLNALRQSNGLSPLPPSAFDGAPVATSPPTSLPSWLPWAAGIGLVFLLTRR